MDPATAMRQASATAEVYAAETLEDLLRFLDISRDDDDWRQQLQPFAGVWSSMIAAAASDFDTAARCGLVDGMHGGADEGGR